MLGDLNSHATIPVSNLDEAKAFYQDVLGLENVGEREGDVMYKTGDTRLLVYESAYAGTNEGTAACWEVNEPEVIVEKLKRRGVVFEQYNDLPGVTRDGDLHRMGPMVAAWFKDPSGNILCIGNAL